MTKMTGIIMAGGNSIRMGKDKALINYHGQAQYLQVKNLLASFCSAVFCSAKSNKFKDVKTVIDNPELGDVGPIAGLITSLEKFQSPIFVLGVDYPLIGHEDLNEIYQNHNNAFPATVFFNPESGFLEPLIGIYEPSILPILKTSLNSGISSIQKILQEHSVQKIIPLNLTKIKSIDLPDDAINIMEGKHEL